MSKEETIKSLKKLKTFHNGSYGTAIDLAIKTLEQQPCEDCIRELIKEFDNKHPSSFPDYFQDYNNHTISKVLDYAWDMHDLIKDIKDRLTNEEGAESEE